MGRTLHYTLKENKKVQVTEANWEEIDKIAQRYIDQYKWTCELPGFSNIDYYPRWPDWFRESGLPVYKTVHPLIEMTREELWDIVNKAYEDLKAKGMTKIQTLSELLNRKLIALHGDDPNHFSFQTAHGFTKVAGNEWNA